MHIEIERKFLVTNDSYQKKAYDHYEIIQGYIAYGKGISVRIRLTEKEAILTIKGRSDDAGVSRKEWNHLISRTDAEELMELVPGAFIKKTRYLVHSGPHVFEVDEFHEDNEGLVIAEVELGAENEPFDKPDFIGQEVTGDRRYYNAHLTINPYKNWPKD